MEKKVELTIDQLESIKETSFNSGMASNQGHNKASKETLTMFAGLKDILELKFNSIEVMLKNHNESNDKDNKAIIEQTTKTNGRVNKLENETIPNLMKNDIQPLKDWKNGLLGAWAVLSLIVIGLIIPLTLNYLKNVDKTDALTKQIGDITTLLNKAEITTTK